MNAKVQYGRPKIQGALERHDQAEQPVQVSSNVFCL